MNIKLSVMVLVALVIAACTGTSPYGETTHASYVAPQLGIVTDGDLQVIEIRAGSAADEAGVQVGDVLLDLTWIPSDVPLSRPDASDIVYLPNSPLPLPSGVTVTDGQPLTTVVGGVVVPAGVAVTPIPPPVGDYIEKATVPFTEGDRIRSLSSYGVPLKLRLTRDGQVIDVTITPSNPPIEPPEPNVPMATFTPVMPPHHYF